VISLTVILDAASRRHNDLIQCLPVYSACQFGLSKIKGFGDEGKIPIKNLHHSKCYGTKNIGVVVCQPSSRKVD